MHSCSNIYESFLTNYKIINILFYLFFWFSILLLYLIIVIQILLNGRKCVLMTMLFHSISLLYNILYIILHWDMYPLIDFSDNQCSLWLLAISNNACLTIIIVIWITLDCIFIIPNLQIMFMINFLSSYYNTWCTDIEPAKKHVWTIDFLPNLI